MKLPVVSSTGLVPVTALINDTIHTEGDVFGLSPVIARREIMAKRVEVFKSPEGETHTVEVSDDGDVKVVEAAKPAAAPAAKGA